MKKFINKSLLVGFIFFVFSFFVWSKVFAKISNQEKNVNILGTETILASFSPTPTQLPTPLPTNNPSPSIKPTNSPTSKPTTSPKPTSTPKPSSSPVTMQELDEWFTKYANKESINPDLLKKIAYCESKYDPKAVNNGYAGLFQFSKNTWISTRTAMNLNNDPDLRFDSEEAIKTAAFRLATEGPGAWPNCKN